MWQWIFDGLIKGITGPIVEPKFQNHVQDSTNCPILTLIMINFRSSDSLRYRDGTPYSHTQLKPITASVSLPLSGASRPPHVTSSLSHVTSSQSRVIPSLPQRTSSSSRVTSGNDRTVINSDSESGTKHRHSSNSASCNKHRNNERGG